MIGILAGHQPVLDARPASYVGRLTIEVYDDLNDVHLGYGGPGIEVGHMSNDAKGRAAHALAIEANVLSIAREAERHLQRSGFNLTSLPDSVRSVAPASTSHSTHFVGRTVVERWHDGELRVAVHVVGSTGVDEVAFAKSCLDRAVAKLTLVTRVLRSRPTALRHHEGGAKQV
jgi:hypothetical protein